MRFVGYAVGSRTVIDISRLIAFVHRPVEGKTLLVARQHAVVTAKDFVVAQCTAIDAELINQQCRVWRHIIIRAYDP